MPFRFACPQCGQLFRVSRSKVGLQLRCPKCQASIIVPSEQEAGVQCEPIPPAPEVPHFSPQTGSAFVPAAQPEHAAEQVEQVDAGTPGRSDKKVAVSRRVIYAQGMLLAIVGMIAFVFGMLFEAARHAGHSAPQHPAGPFAMHGTVTYQARDGKRQPDGGSAVLAVPVDLLPDEKLHVAGLRPDDPPVPDDDPTLRALRALGGAYGRTGHNGEIRLEIPRSGPYYLLCLSANARRSPYDTPAIKVTAQLGRYVHSAVDLLGDRQYRWTQVRIKNDMTLDWEFDQSTD